ncbi:MAG: superoxide dismutase [Pseudomonadota bacterium]
MEYKKLFNTLNIDELPTPIYWLEQSAVDIHMKKHHQTYINKLQDLIKDLAEYQNLSLTEIIIKAFAVRTQTNKYNLIFNNAAQVWNHNFFWLSIKQNTKISSKTLKLINNSFENIDKFHQELISKGLSQFGSGWVWVILDNNNKITIHTTGNAETPILYNEKVLLTCDLWEHSYYLKYKNDRKKYLEDFINYINWELIEYQINN